MSIKISKYSIIPIICLIYLSSCNERDKYTRTPFFDSKKTHIGDTVFLDGRIDKIIFKDTSYKIDSIVYRWYKNSPSKLYSIVSMRNNNHVFENIYYHENGNIKEYHFHGDENSSLFYDRYYDNYGNLQTIEGDVFFIAYFIDTLNNNPYKVKFGTTTEYRLYYPNPPDCISNIFLKSIDGKQYNVFNKSSFLNYLLTSYQDNKIKEGIFRADIELQLKEKKLDSTAKYCMSYIFEVFK